MINHELLKRYQHDIDKFHESACKHHGVEFLDLSITSGYIQPVGEYLEVKTSKGDTWSTESDKYTPSVYYSPAGDYATKYLHFTIEAKTTESYKTKVLSHDNGSFTLRNTKFSNEAELYEEVKRLVTEEALHYANDVYSSDLTEEEHEAKVVGFKII